MNKKGTDDNQLIVNNNLSLLILGMTLVYTNNSGWQSTRLRQVVLWQCAMNTLLLQILFIFAATWLIFDGARILSMRS